MFEGIPIPSRVARCANSVLSGANGSVRGLWTCRVGAFLTAHVGWSWRE